MLIAASGLMKCMAFFMGGQRDAMWVTVVCNGKCRCHLWTSLIMMQNVKHSYLMMKKRPVLRYCTYLFSSVI
jgi:hypothetical protein